MMNNKVKLLIAMAVPLVIGLISGSFTASQIPVWYAHLNKPSWNPPSWLFAPVWTILYIMMGIALYLVWKSDAIKSIKKTAILCFEIQLILNFCWSFIFFNQHQMGMAFVDILLLLFFIIATIFSFKKISLTAAWLMLPYLLWVGFAACLNYTIWQLNK
jgi:benzodiazapine receptor